MPLRHLIVLIFDAHPEHVTASCAGRPRGVTVLRDPPHGIKAILKTSLLRMLFDGGAVTLPPGASHGLPRGHDPSCDRPNNLLLHDVRQHVQTLEVRNEFLVSSGRVRSIAAHNRTPRKGSGGARRDRTDDLMLAKHALSQLSYGPWKMRLHMVSTPIKWWAWDDSNVRPHPYQGCALTT